VAELWSVRAELEHAIRSRGTNAEVTADVVSETFVVVWRRLHDVPLDEGSARAWIFTTARNIQANLYRRSRHRAELERAVAAQPALTVPPEPVSTRLEALEVFESLSRDDQRLLRRVVSEGPTVVGLAEWLGCSEAAAATRLSRARARLDTAMQAEGAGAARRRPRPGRSTIEAPIVAHEFSK
jgi:RNA polymerase sigma-70 factor (ECF subfamily)